MQGFRPKSRHHRCPQVLSRSLLYYTTFAMASPGGPRTRQTQGLPLRSASGILCFLRDNDTLGLSIFRMCDTFSCWVKVQTFLGSPWEEHIRLPGQEASSPGVAHEQAREIRKAPESRLKRGCSYGRTTTIRCKRSSYLVSAYACHMGRPRSASRTFT